MQIVLPWTTHLKELGIEKHVLDKQIPRKMKQMLSNLDVYTSEFILLCTEYNKKSILYELKVHLC